MKYIITCLLTLFLCSCSTIINEQEFTVLKIDNYEDGEWILEATIGAIDFWDQRGVYYDFVVDDNDNYDCFNNCITITSKLNLTGFKGDLIWGTFRHPNKITISQNIEFLKDRNLIKPLEKCTIAHELGHSLGMKHTKPENDDGKNLMSPIIALKEIGDNQYDCFWSDNDQNEFERVHINGNKSW